METCRGHDWVHYTLRSARALAAYQLHLRTEASVPSNFEGRVYAVSNDDLHRRIIWTDTG
ncbi:hypothetical protein ACLEPN_14130 [Myxococcus sp. 1LA]